MGIKKKAYNKPCVVYLVLHSFILSFDELDVGVVSNFIIGEMKMVEQATISSKMPYWWKPEKSHIGQIVWRNCITKQYRCWLHLKSASFYAIFTYLQGCEPFSWNLTKHVAVYPTMLWNRLLLRKKRCALLSWDCNVCLQKHFRQSMRTASRTIDLCEMRLESGVAGKVFAQMSALILHSVADCM